MWDYDSTGREFCQQAAGGRIFCVGGRNSWESAGRIRYTEVEETTTGGGADGNEMTCPDIGIGPGGRAPLRFRCGGGVGIGDSRGAGGGGFEGLFCRGGGRLRLRQPG